MDGRIAELDSRLATARPTRTSEDPALILQDWTTIQHTMWNYVGIVRTYERLSAPADMRELGSRLTKYYHESTISKAILELFHGQQMAMIVANQPCGIRCRAERTSGAIDGSGRTPPPQASCVRRAEGRERSPNPARCCRAATCRRRCDSVHWWSQR